MTRPFLSIFALALLRQARAASIPAFNELVTRGSDPFDVKTYASLGESFASGPSAGDVYGADYPGCRRYTHAFGPELNGDDRLQGKDGRKFDFFACSGSRLKQVYEDNSKGGSDKPKKSQAGQLDGENPDLTTLSMGGNDIGFVNLLDHCVYRFYDPLCIGCGFFNQDCTQDCNKVVEETQAKIDGRDLASGFDKAIQAIFKAAPKTNLYLTYYPRFFAAETDQCDSVHFATQCVSAKNVLKVTKDRRRAMNKLTDNLNGKIKEAVERNKAPDGASINWVDTNPGFDGHRFCENGVTEPSYRNDQIYFYPNEYTTGNTLDYIRKFDNGTDCNAILGDDGSGDWGEFYACEIAEGANKDPSQFPNQFDGQDDETQGDGDVGTTGSSGSGSLPDFLARIFHPTKNGHMAYKDAILKTYGVDQASSSSAAGDVDCSGGTQISTDSAKNMQEDLASKKGTKTMEITLASAISVDNDSGNQIFAEPVNGKTSGTADYGDLAGALQKIIDNKGCKDMPEGMVAGSITVGDIKIATQMRST